MASQHSTNTDFTSRYKFNAKELDTETGWYYYGARYYNPSTSTWLSVDPLAEDYESWSPYNYTLNNPINLIDPDGRSVLDDVHVFSDGRQLVLKTNDDSDTFFYHDSNGKQHNIGTFKKNNKGLINAPNINYNDGSGTIVKITSKKGNESEIYISSNALGSVIGASADSGESVFITRVSNSDGSSPGKSKSHINGKNIDIRFVGKNGARTPLNYNINSNDFNKIDMNGSTKLNTSLKKFGYNFIGASIKTTIHSKRKNGFQTIISMSSQEIPGTRHLNNHYDHLHLQGYRPTVRKIKKPIAISIGSTIGVNTNF